MHLNTGSVIKAWDLGVATMKCGELAMFTCKPKYAYGKKGSPPKVPPNATLIFEIELFEWKGMFFFHKTCKVFFIDVSG